MTKPKQIKIPENITINFPADALSVIENGENAYIYANGVTYRVIENKRYWNEIEEIKAQALSTQLEEVIELVETTIGNDYHNIGMGSLDYHEKSAIDAFIESFKFRLTKLKGINEKHTY